MNRPRAMTLLEVVLAVTLLASMSALVAALWSQASRWTGDSASHHRAMRLPRVLEMLRTQWADRRTSARLDRSGSTVELDTEALTFVSATAILRPGWPLVRARFVIERDRSPSVVNREAWRLVYEELPIVDLVRAQGVPRTFEGARLQSAPVPSEDEARRAYESPVERRIVLLADCASLRWERWGQHRRVEEPEELPEPDPRPPGETGSADASEPPPEPPARAFSDAEKTFAWRELESEFRGRPTAIRLTGIYEEKPFACVFIIGDSR